MNAAYTKGEPDHVGVEEAPYIQSLYANYRTELQISAR
jgi:hypothetical protein